jgi:hypothetical protein
MHVPHLRLSPRVDVPTKTVSVHTGRGARMRGVPPRFPLTATKGRRRQKAGGHPGEQLKEALIPALDLERPKLAESGTSPLECPKPTSRRSSLELSRVDSDVMRKFMPCKPARELR